MTCQCEQSRILRRVVTVETTPFTDQAPGTSGLRRTTKVFRQPNYVENYVQCIIKAIGECIENSTIVVGGDGRFYGEEAAAKVIRMLAAAGVRRVMVGQNAFMSTPAISAVIRKYCALGGFVLTASHNPGGPYGDFGIKFNTANGGPALGLFTRKVALLARHICNYRIAPDIPIDLSEVGEQKFNVDGREFVIEVIDPVADYVELMKEVFSFKVLRRLLSTGMGELPFRIIVDCMHGASGPYVFQILCLELGAPFDSVMNALPVSDFGGIPPDPNLQNAQRMMERVIEYDADMGVALDGDADRNLIVGRGAFFVNPADSLAIISAHLCSIPYFYRKGVTGFARSMPTAAAVDRVAKELNVPCYEVATGWKHFGNLMDADMVCLCGEESFGTGSNHIREKDGIWAMLAWLSVVACMRMSVQDIVCEHWQKFGRNYFARMDFVICESCKAKKIMQNLECLVSSGDLIGQSFVNDDCCMEICCADNYYYVDPVDESVARDQGVRIIFSNESKIVYRLSGTDTKTTTLRVYVERYQPDPEKVCCEVLQVLQPLMDAAIQIARLEEFICKTTPDLIT